MIERVTTEIEGRTYRFKPLPGTQARKLFVELLQKFGGAWGDGVEHIGSISQRALTQDHMSVEFLLEMLPTMAGSIGAFIKKALVAVDPDYYNDLCKLVLERVELDFEDPETGERLNPPLTEQYRDTHFGTKLLLESRILTWALREQYADFFTWFESAQNAISIYLEALAENYASRKGSTGGNGDLPQPTN